MYNDKDCRMGVLKAFPKKKQKESKRCKKVGFTKI
jgi:hypothetical protein